MRSASVHSFRQYLGNRCCYARDSNHCCSNRYCSYRYCSYHSNASYHTGRTSHSALAAAAEARALVRAARAPVVCDIDPDSDNIVPGPWCRTLRSRRQTTTVPGLSLQVFSCRSVSWSPNLRSCRLAMAMPLAQSFAQSTELADRPTELADRRPLVFHIVST